MTHPRRGFLRSQWSCCQSLCLIFYTYKSSFVPPPEVIARSSLGVIKLYIILFSLLLFRRQSTPIFMCSKFLKNTSFLFRSSFTPLTPERTTQTLWNKDCSCFLWPFHVVLVSTCSQLVPAFLPHSPQHTNTLTLFYFICTFICTKLSCHESLPQGTHRISSHWSPPRLVTTCLSSFCLPFFLFYAATFNATVGL